mmetsp:Transcript_36293/g.43844  ORF Transcript_36293/g.43844 Transcript_36293/m.43844 type:complete len:674 (+) Transcript_36293:355-2376(+)|eukprot:CAMPEP_0197846918 /NCGR_PEP_ID=MMETSP1438-20131217/4717_1 /TAXON_ID=1461541 /ORGANISM="Pterosperma sp., Strain CCMP1384" /LENGTH=673 /DNA_ID=CAMNT_0043458707 /DNA_START=355 /DNA_END=2376 /DNA_ORIENTATION=+
MAAASASPALVSTARGIPSSSTETTIRIQATSCQSFKRATGADTQPLLQSKLGLSQKGRYKIQLSHSREPALTCRSATVPFNESSSEDDQKTIARDRASRLSNSMRSYRSASRSNGDVDVSVPLIFGFRRNFDMHYTMCEKIGEGGFGTVFRCIENETNKEFAVKILPKEHLTTPEKQERMRREILNQRRMSPSLSVTYLYDEYEDDKSVYLVMELCKGGHLWQRIKRGQYSEAKAAKIIAAAIQSIAQCHAVGIMLRDIKPSNFLFLTEAEDSPLKITDFGLAVNFKPGHDNREMFSERVGTSQYLAPEVVGRLTSWPPETHYGPKADLWALGVLAYQLLCGRLPHKMWRKTPTPSSASSSASPANEMHSLTKDLNSGDVFAAIAFGELDFETAPWDSLSPMAQDFLKSLLVKDPAARMNAHQAAKHPWLQQGATSEDPLDDELCNVVVSSLQANALQRLQRYGLYGHLKQAAFQSIAQKMFTSYSDSDADAAPFLESAELHDLRQLFKELSPTGDVSDAYLSSEQIKQFLKDSAYAVDAREVDQLLLMLNVAQDGEEMMVHLPEFIAALCDWQSMQGTTNEQIWDDWVEQTFREFDSEGVGALDADAIEAALGPNSPASHGVRKIVASWEIEGADKNGDGVIDLQEFKELLKNEWTSLEHYDDRNTIEECK